MLPFRLPLLAASALALAGCHTRQEAVKPPPPPVVAAVPVAPVPPPLTDAQRAARDIQAAQARWKPGESLYLPSHPASSPSADSEAGAASSEALPDPPLSLHDKLMQEYEDAGEQYQALTDQRADVHSQEGAIYVARAQCDPNSSTPCDNMEDELTHLQNLDIALSQRQEGLIETMRGASERMADDTREAEQREQVHSQPNDWDSYFPAGR